VSIRGIVFLSLAILGAILNFTARFTSGKTGISELKIKVSALIIVVLSVVLLFVFGK